MQSGTGDGKTLSLGETGKAQAGFIVCGEGSREKRSLASTCQEA